MLRRVEEPASHLAHSDHSRTRRTPQGALVERRRGQSLQRLRHAYASAVVVVGSAACTSRKPCAVCGSVTNIPARTVLAGTRAQSPVRCDGLARGPSPQQRPGVGPQPPAARLAGCNPAAAAHRAAGPAERCAGPGHWQWADPLGPRAAACGPWRSWIPGPRWAPVRRAACRTAPPRCCLWGCPRPGGDRTHGKSGANDNPAQSACNWHHEPEICHSELRRWRRCTG